MNFDLIKKLIFLSFLSMINCDWQTSSVCIDIPSNFTLCKNIGYTKMKLPNLFGHDTLAEAYQQANGWMPLFQLGCHPKTKLFLCSLFTPVCLDQTIPPCRSLCESVKASCSPYMLQHGYPWPRIVDCAQYPKDNGMCISLEIQHQNNKNKDQDRLKTNLILNAYCQSDWILKVKGSLIVNRLNETATLYVNNYTVLKGEFSNEQHKILPVILNDLRFLNELLVKNLSSSSQRSKNIQTFKKYTFILFGKTSQKLNNQYEKLTLFFPLTNKLPNLKRLYNKKIRTNNVNCYDENLQTINLKSTDFNLESVLNFEKNNLNITTKL